MLPLKRDDPPRYAQGARERDARGSLVFHRKGSCRNTCWNEIRHSRRQAGEPARRGEGGRPWQLPAFPRNAGPEKRAREAPGCDATL